VRAAIYLRQSVDVKEGIDRQRVRTSALVKARGWKLVGEYPDNDTSATKSRAAGTGWSRLLDDIRGGKVDAVVAVDVDRLLRDIRDLGTLMDLGAKVVTVDGEIDLSTADGEFRATMLAGIARFEVRRKAERQKRANEQRVAQGKRTGASRRQFGYAKDGVTLIEREAAAVRDGYDSLLSGVPLAGIARDWNGRGLVTTQRTRLGEPSPWTPGSVRSVLSNPRNAAIVTYRGEEQPGVEAEWPALVSVETFRAAAAIFADPSRRHLPRYGKHLLSSLAACGVEGCGGHAFAGGNARRGVPGYRCSASAGHFARMSHPIEEYVIDVVVKRLSRSDARDLLVKPGEDTKALRREALAIERRIEELAGLVADGTFTAAQARSGAERLRSQLADIEERIADAGRVDILGPLVADTDEEVRARWEALDVDRQRAVIDVLMTVTLYPVGRGKRGFRPQTVGIAWKSDEDSQSANMTQDEAARVAILMPRPTAVEVAGLMASGWTRHRLAEHYGRSVRTADKWIGEAYALERLA